MRGDSISDNIVVFPVIAGTVYGEIEKAFPNGFGHRLVPLPPLSRESMEKIFRTCLPSHEHWLDFVPFQRLLYLMASTPRVLEIILTIIQSMPVDKLPTQESIQSMATDVQSQLLYKFDLVRLINLLIMF